MMYQVDSELVLRKSTTVNSSLILSSVGFMKSTVLTNSTKYRGGVEDIRLEAGPARGFVISGSVQGVQGVHRTRA